MGEMQPSTGVTQYRKKIHHQRDSVYVKDLKEGEKGALVTSAVIYLCIMCDTLMGKM
jgi:hypothetical protein